MPILALSASEIPPSVFTPEEISISPVIRRDAHWEVMPNGFNSEARTPAAPAIMPEMMSRRIKTVKNTTKAQMLIMDMKEDLTVSEKAAESLTLSISEYCSLPVDAFSPLL